MAERKSCLSVSKTRCMGALSRIKDVFIYLWSYKYALTVFLTCLDVITDFWNGISLLYKGLSIGKWTWEPENSIYSVLFGGMMLFLIWFPGIMYAISQAANNRSGGCIRSTFLFVPTVFLFPFRMLIFGFGSIVVWNPNKMASKNKFLEMKDFEVLWESSFQFYFNYVYLAHVADDISPINYISLAISFLSLFAGIFGATTKNTEEQRKIEIQLAGKIIITLIVASVLTSFLIFSHLPQLYSLDAYIYDMAYIYDTTIVHYCSISYIIRLCLVSAYFMYECFYILVPTKQRITSHEQRNGFFLRALFWTVLPTLVNLKHNKMYYLPFILLKIVPTIVIHEFVLLYMYTDIFNSAFYPFSLKGAGIVVYYVVFTVLNLLYIIYPFKTDWFYTTKTEEDSLPEDQETALSTQKSQETIFLAQEGQGTIVAGKVDKETTLLRQHGIGQDTTLLSNNGQEEAMFPQDGKGTLSLNYHGQEPSSPGLKKKTCPLSNNQSTVLAVHDDQGTFLLNYKKQEPSSPSNDGTLKSPGSSAIILHRDSSPSHETPGESASAPEPLRQPLLPTNDNN